MCDKGLIFKICKQLTQTKKGNKHTHKGNKKKRKPSKERKKKTQCKKGQKIEIDIFTKEIYRWPTGT